LFAKKRSSHLLLDFALIVPQPVPLSRLQYLKTIYLMNLAGSFREDYKCERFLARLHYREGDLRGSPPRFASPGRSRSAGQFNLRQAER
jgi:hypothetical protein